MTSQTVIIIRFNYLFFILFRTLPLFIIKLRCVSFYIGDEYFTHVSDVVRAVFEDIIMEMAMLLKPGPLVVKKKGDPEQLAKDWDDYVKVFQVFLGAKGGGGCACQPRDSQQSLCCVSEGQEYAEVGRGGPGMDSF